jgi:hydrogenase maturation protease
MSERILVIGVGNLLMGDDGLGLAALEQLQADRQWPAAVEFVDGGGWGISLLPAIEDADEVILLDAIEAHREPGELVILEGDDLPRMFDFRISPHHIGIQDVLALLEFRGTRPERLAAIGVQPARVEWGVGLSPEVAAAVPGLVDTVMARLADHGVIPLGREPIHA